MKKSDIIGITFKILGLWLFMKILYDLPMLFNFVILYKDASSIEVESNNQLLLQTGVSYALLVTFSILFIFGSRSLARIVCGKDDFTERVELFSDKKLLFESIILIIGGILFISTLPDFLISLIYHIRDVQNDKLIIPGNVQIIVKLFIKLLLSVVIIYYHKPVSEFLTRKKDKTNEPEINLEND